MYVKNGMWSSDAEEKDGAKKILNASYASQNEENSWQESLRSRGRMREEVPCPWPSTKNKKVWVGVVAAVVVVTAVGAAVALGCASHILHQLGFTSAGVAKKTYAARLMSSTSRANNHTIPRDSWASWLQRAGQKGPSTEHYALFGAGGAAVGVVLAVVAAAVCLAGWHCRRRMRARTV